MKENIKNKRNLLVKIIIVIIVLIIVGINLVKNRIDENSYNKMYENLQIENIEEENNKVENLVTVSDEQEDKIKVYVTGAVNNPSVVEMNRGERIQEAINLAGGAKDDANLEEVNLAYCLEDGQKIYIPSINEKETEYLSTENGEKIIEDSKNTSTSKVNINKAGVEELKSLPGVGASLAQRIIDYRSENGKFKTVEELENVSGIGQKKLEGMKEYLSVK